MDEYYQINSKPTFAKTVGPDAPFIYRLLDRVGIKPASNRVYALIRVMVIILITIILIRSVILDKTKKEEPVTLTSMSDVIKPGTKLYKTIDEMKPDAQAAYLNGLKYAIDSSKPDDSFVRKYLQALGAALVANLLSEHIVNGNISKPVSTIAKSVFYSTAYAVTTMK